MGHTTEERLRRSRRLAPLAVIALLGLVTYLASPPEIADWGRFMSAARITGTSAEHYDSLEGLSASGDLVVVGRLESVQRGREWISDPELLDDPMVGSFAFVRFATANLVVDRVLGSTGAGPATIPVEILVLHWDQVAELQANLPAQEGLFFLRHKAGEANGQFYRLVNMDQGVIGSESGKAVVPGSGHEPSFLRRLNGRDFGEVVAEVEAILLR